MAMRVTERRQRHRKDVRKHVTLMRRVAQQAVSELDPRDPRPAPSPPWWSTVFSSRYKTELCHHLEEEGRCSFGAGCVYAHSRSELRPIQRHPKHRSQLCKDYHDDGFCSFGARCSFIHAQRDLAALLEEIGRSSAHVHPMPENPGSRCQSLSGSSAPSGWSSPAMAVPAKPANSRRQRGRPAAKIREPRRSVAPYHDDRPVARTPTLLDRPLEPGFRKRWGVHWQELPRRRLQVFENMCPQN
ncbi:mRNA decay activator protein ZFP36-like [Ixodes scapularis]|uniref:mRNA decay activator protein ZFP36-like n=1 Tax=Ixodes scapularis TaxID=6945 RepID=UPI001C38814C|nr:mRNA decay activator protein ZFP36-like [Ixodes scapularis]